MPFSKLKSNFQKPYYVNNSVRFRLIQALLFGVFVVVFLIIFQPFNVIGLGEKWMLYCLGFGAVTTFIMCVLNVAIPLIAPEFFKDERWTLGKEIGYSMLNLCGIAFGNTLYFLILIDQMFSWNILLWFLPVTISVGIIPILFLAFYKERRDAKHYQQHSSELNHKLEEKINKTVDQKETKEVVLNSQNKSEHIAVIPQEIWWATAADNYVEIYTANQTILIRNTLKKVAEDLEEFPFIFRCHKSYLINLNEVKNVSGNAQGYKLHLQNTAKTIPVSRKLNGEIKERIGQLTP